MWWPPSWALRSAAEAGTTRATPSVGVATNRVREDDSAKARKPGQPGSTFYSNSVTTIHSLRCRGLTREKGERSAGLSSLTPLLRAGAASGSSLGHGFRRRQWPSSLRLSLVALGTRLKVGLGTPAPPVVVMRAGGSG